MLPVNIFLTMASAIGAAKQIARPEWAVAAPGTPEMRELDEQVRVECDSIYHRVKGNKANYTEMSVADQLLMCEGALRRAVEILDEAEKEKARAET